MSLAENPAPPIDRPRPSRRTFGKAFKMWLRRGHLYFGLFLFPWAILYGVTAFLFNHPQAFSDRPSTPFGPEALAGTPMESLPSPAEQADAVVAKLNEVQKPSTPYTRAGEAKYGPRDSASASLRSGEQTHTIVFDVRNGGGAVRSAPVAVRKEVERAPFAVGSATNPGRGGGGKGPNGPPRGGSAAGLKLDDSLADRVKKAAPAVLKSLGLDAEGELSVTAVPEVVFPIEAGGRVWTASYNALTGSVGGTPADAKTENEMSVRNFLLRLHTAHGYPSEANARWYWAVVVDLMAFVMCFWGLTGLVMWWQIKATRRAGAVVLVLSTIAATWLGTAMHAAMAG